MSKKQKAVTAAEELILLLPLATRKLASGYIDDLTAYLGIETNLKVDQRLAKNYRKHTVYGYQISITGGDTWCIDSLEDSARCVLMKPQSLKSYLDRNHDGPNTFCKTVNDQIITVVRHIVDDTNRHVFKDALPQKSSRSY